MFKRKKNLAIVNSLVGQQTIIGGNVDFVGGLRVDGTIQGSVRGGADSVLTVTKTGRICGSIEANHAIIDGTVDGPLVVCEMLELMPSAVVTGDITYQTLRVHPGALITGTLSLSKKVES